MKRRFLLILLAACLGLTACQSRVEPQPSAEPPAATNKPAEPSAPETEPAPPETEPVPPMPELPEGSGLGLNALDAKLIAYLQANGLEQESFTVSPLSLKAALALTALGAEGETQRQILDALGFADVLEQHGRHRP